MITDELIVKHAPEPPLRERPIIIAADFYRRWIKDQTLLDDLDEYQFYGVVVSRPDIFLLARRILDPHPKHQGELAWFIRMFVGDIGELMRALPQEPIKRICFCRHGDPRVRSWPIERMLKLEKLDLHKRRKLWAAAA